MISSILIIGMLYSKLDWIYLQILFVLFIPLAYKLFPVLLIDIPVTVHDTVVKFSLIINFIFPSGTIFRL